MTNNQPFDCLLSQPGRTLRVLRLLVHDEVARFPTALALVRAETVGLHEGPYSLALQDEVGGARIEGLGAASWYVNEATRLPSSNEEQLDLWLLRLGVVQAQTLPMRALVAEGQSADDILHEVCQEREGLKPSWAGEPFAARLGTVVAFGESSETFLRRFARSLNCWFAYRGQPGVVWSQQGLDLLGLGTPASTVPTLSEQRVPAPEVVRVFWSASLAPVSHHSEAATALHAYEVVQATEVDMPEPMTSWPTGGQRRLHLGLSDDARHFTLGAAQAMGGAQRAALAVIHAWSVPGSNDLDEVALGRAFASLIPGLMPDALNQHLAANTGYAVLTLSVDEANTLRYLDGSLLLEQHHLRGIADRIAARLQLGVMTRAPVARAAAGLMPATVTSLAGNVTGVPKEVDYAALPAAGAPDLRSARVRIRFDWHPQAIEVPMATPWLGAGGSVFFPPRCGDRVLVQFIDGDYSAPVVVGALSAEQDHVERAFQSPGAAFHANQPQGISARDGLVLETTETGDLVLYAKKGNLILRARDTVLLQGRTLDERFARTASSGHAYDKDDHHG